MENKFKRYELSQIFAMKFEQEVGKLKSLLL